ncbi:MAG: ERCC4 domain-containing protein [Lachnospiraceae bacterium]|nr:ERCC4 domain-containing protein [Lachnospiraceae bacterium]
MTIQIDSREHKKERERIEKQFDRLGIDHFVSKLWVGDYMSLDNAKLVIDRKLDLNEVCGNVCQQHERFRKELTRAKDQGIQIIILIEEPNIMNLVDVWFWENPRKKAYKWVIKNGHPWKEECKKPPLQGKQLYKSLVTIEERYGVRFEFCNKKDTGKRIFELLGGDIKC